MKPNSVGSVLTPTAVPGSRIPQRSLPQAVNRRPRHGAAGPSLWSAFWQEFCLENVPHERCHIPGDGRNVVDRHWAYFAELLPLGAEVIDIGCGAGIVGRLLLSNRADLRVTGIDFANVPTPTVANLTICPWVNMEALPFEDSRFDAAISLFGIEYGNINETARELGRVLKPGAPFSFLVHHVESEIVCEGGTRRRGLRELLSGTMKSPFLSGDVAGVDRQIKRLTVLFPEEPSVRHFSNYLRHYAVGTRAERQSKWQELLDGLNPEVALLMQLERSAKSAENMGNWLVSLFPIMRKVSVSVLRRSSGEPIAWQVNGIK